MPIDGSYVSAAAGYYDILVTDCIPWVANMAGIWETEHGYHMNDLSSSRGGAEEELSSLIFSFGLISGEVSYLLI